MKFQLLITKADNGFILEWQDEGEGDSVIDHEEVFEEKESELECMQYMLLRVKEYFGVYYSKHNKENLVIEIVKRKEEEDE